MNPRFCKSLTIILLTTTLGVSETRFGVSQQTTSLETRNELSLPQTVVPEVSPQLDVIKVGAYQSQQEAEEGVQVIATIYPHQVNELEAATLYVKDIPVLTFLGHEQGTGTDILTQQGQKNISPVLESEETFVQDALWRATTLAAQINQLNRDNIDPQNITVHWLPEENLYGIQVGEQSLVNLNEKTVSPDSIGNPAADALQVANRLRRLMGNVAPIEDIIGRPIALTNLLKPPKVAKKQLLRSIGRGIASWYGPGFHGRRSANGERFNQNALTAAHRHLPFGTQVRVTNMNNGRSVIVRINDRGPFIHGRVIDLSAAAARVIGMMQTGVAPVHLEIVSE